MQSRRWKPFEKFRNTSFRTRLMMLVLLSVGAPSLLMYFVTLQTTEAFQTEHIKDKFHLVLSNTRREINNWHRDRALDLERLLQSNGFQRPLAEYYKTGNRGLRVYQLNEIKRYFAIVSEKFPVFEEFIVLDHRGRVIVSDQTLSPEQTAVLQSLQKKSDPHPAISRSSFSSDGRTVHQWVAVTVEIASRKTTTCGRINLDGLSEVLQRDKLSAVGDLFLIDHAGRYLTQPQHPGGESVIGQQAQDVPQRESREGTVSIERYTKGGIGVNGQAARMKFIGSKTHIAENDWWLVCEDKEEKVIAPMVARKHHVLIADSLITMLFMFVTWKLSRQLLQPVADLSEGARKINMGLKGVQIPGGGSHEVGQMIAAFNDMARQIAMTEAKLSKKNQELQDQNRKLESLNDELERLSITDGLTGLFNHRHFWNLMNQELARADRYEGEVGLVLIDIDNFKSVNDRFGHATGDVLIQHVGRVIVENVRGTDYVARYGGEEFAILLPDSSKSGVRYVSEKIRRAVEELVFKVPETDITVSVTASVGVSVFRGNQLEFFNSADEALYASKAGGKNRVSFATSIA